jgi:hypothetical protein
MYRSEKKSMQTLITTAKTNHYKAKVEECDGDQGRILKLVSHLQNVKAKPTLPEHDNVEDLCNAFNTFFVKKVTKSRSKLDEIQLPSTPDSNGSEISHRNQVHPTLSPSTIFQGQTLSNSREISKEEMTDIIKKSSNATCETDPLPTNLVKSCLLDTLLPVICKIIKLSL